MTSRAASSTGVTITNPLVLYRALLATKRIRADPAQHRLALHLQKLYDRLKDYEPTSEYSDRLKQLSRAVGSAGPPGSGSAAPVAEARTRDSTTSGLWRGLVVRRERRESVALTRTLTSHEAAMALDSPKGLMLHGEVGTGKSMLVDLFADCLPNRKKRRWHFNTFMLETLARLEHLRQVRSLRGALAPVGEEDHSLLWLAREMIQTSPILFLDEFQLPDRAASKIMANLLTGFFHLGGVLIATSNRMPEELAKAAGMEFSPPPTRMESLRWRFGVGEKVDRSRNMFSGQGDFGPFLEVLKARCEVWEMEGGKDYRRSESEAAAAKSLEPSYTAGVGELPDSSEAPVVHLDGPPPVSTATPDDIPKMATLPKNYFVKPSATSSTSDHEQWAHDFRAAELHALSHTQTATSSPIPWEPSTMLVYGRLVPVPRQHAGVTAWTFSELCAARLGPADYITLASTFHTLILTDVPTLSLLQKNEARRFITLLDALYEARCKLLITAAAGPDDIFFPETRGEPNGNSNNAGSQASITHSQNPRPGPNDATPTDADALHSETFSDIYQDATAPFRPNISSYGSSSAGLSPDSLEDDPPNRLRHRSGGSGSLYSDERDMGAAARAMPDFGQASAFTGEDERFAFKRARSRLWEMCGGKWWGRVDEEGAETGWWRPVGKEVRSWEVSAAERTVRLEELAGEDGQGSRAWGQQRRDGFGNALGGEDGGIGEAGEVDVPREEVLFRHGASPFRVSREAPPKIGWTHVWGTMRWGKRAGVWGKGVDGVEERRREKREGRAGEGKE